MPATETSSFASPGTSSNDHTPETRLQQTTVEHFATMAYALEQSHAVFVAQHVEQHAILADGQGLMRDVQTRAHELGQAFLALASQFLLTADQTIAVDDPNLVPFATELGIRETAYDTVVPQAPHPVKLDRESGMGTGAAVVILGEGIDPEIA